jgi:hypothetical protein
MSHTTQAAMGRETVHGNDADIAFFWRNKATSIASPQPSLLLFSTKKHFHAYALSLSHSPTNITVSTTCKSLPEKRGYTKKECRKNEVAIDAREET